MGVCSGLALLPRGAPPLARLRLPLASCGPHARSSPPEPSPCQQDGVLPSRLPPQTCLSIPDIKTAFSDCTSKIGRRDCLTQACSALTG